jgi:hypothetical protein
MVEVNKKEKYQVAVAKYLIGDFPTERFPDLASEALEDGIDTPTIIEIAGLKQPSYFDIQEFIPKLLDELGIPPLTKHEAGLFLAKNIAGKIVSGELDPEKGAKELEQLWFKMEYSLREWLENFSLADDLISSLTTTPDKNDQPRARDEMRKRIISDAKDLLEGKSLIDWDLKHYLNH